jgi:hypothetical protein
MGHQAALISISEAAAKSAKPAAALALAGVRALRIAAANRRAAGEGGRMEEAG